DGELRRRTAVELRGTSGTGTRTSGEAPELHVEQAFGDEPVQVELRGVHREVERRRRLLATDRVRLCDDVEVQGTPRRFGKGRDAGDPVQMLRHDVHPFQGLPA